MRPGLFERKANRPAIHGGLRSGWLDEMRNTKAGAESFGGRLSVPTSKGVCERNLGRTELFRLHRLFDESGTLIALVLPRLSFFVAFGENDAI